MKTGGSHLDGLGTHWASYHYSYWWGHQDACQELQDYDFENHHWAGCLHANVDALSRHPSEIEQCRYCQRIEGRVPANLMVLALQTTPWDNNSGRQDPSPPTSGNNCFETIDSSNFKLTRACPLLGLKMDRARHETKFQHWSPRLKPSLPSQPTSSVQVVTSTTAGSPLGVTDMSFS